MANNSSGAEAQWKRAANVGAKAPTPKSLPQITALFALRFYKAYLSILMAGSCRFEPTCSQYAYEAIERFGAMRGSWLALRRLLRCQPLSRKFGFDPVPESRASVPLSAISREIREFPQGLKPSESEPLVSELKLRPPSEPFADTPAHKEAHS